MNIKLIIMRPINILGLISYSLLALTACQSEPVVSAALSPATAVPTQPITATLAPPQINIVTDAATQSAPNPPAFNLVDPDDLVTSTPLPTETAATITASATEKPVDTPTPQPTYTPPALPQTALDEHYWLRRPIPEGGTVWTDKTYPYGSTRGGTLDPHHGVEFYVPTGTAVLAAASGIVRVAGPDSVDSYGPHPNFYGNLVIIEHDSRWNGEAIFTVYGHLSQVLVAVGQNINAQDLIALSGATGVADGPHLHFEVRQGSNSYDQTRNPLLWLWPFPDRGTVAGRVTFADGSLAYGAPVRAVRVDAPSDYAATTTYADNSLNPDTVLNENFAIDDIAAGYYEIIVDTSGKKFKEELWVYPRRTSFVEIVLEN